MAFDFYRLQDAMGKPGRLEFDTADYATSARRLLLSDGRAIVASEVWDNGLSETFNAWLLTVRVPGFVSTYM